MSHKHTMYLVYSLIVMSILFFGSILIFFLGYQLAIYQTANGDTWFPHFNVSNNNNGSDCGGDYPSPPCCDGTDTCPIAAKPVIYLYPTIAEKVKVNLDFPAGFSVSIPTYNSNSGWNVNANPNGTLTNLSDNKQYPYLYWEGNPQPFNFDMTKGFVVSNDQAKTFLEKELPIIGLNKNESAGFIEYWLPKLQQNKLSLIHFAGSDYTAIAKLNISPHPNSLLRVFMVEQPIKLTQNISPQTFPVFHRNGFTVVEWGGTIKSE